MLTRCTFSDYHGVNIINNPTIPPMVIVGCMYRLRTDAGIFYAAAYLHNLDAGLTAADGLGSPLTKNKSTFSDYHNVSSAYVFKHLSVCGGCSVGAALAGLFMVQLTTNYANNISGDAYILDYQGSRLTNELVNIRIIMLVRTLARNLTVLVL